MATLRCAWRWRRGLAAELWLLRYGDVMPGSASTWGAVLAWVLLDPHFDSATRTTALVATAGFSTVFANVYAMARSVAIAGMVVMMGPALVVLWVLRGQLPLAAIMSLYAEYLAFALVMAHSDHRRRLDLDQALHQQRDLFERLSRTHPLTGLHNRRHFNAELDVAAERAWSGSTGFALGTWRSEAPVPSTEDGGGAGHPRTVLANRLVQRQWIMRVLYSRRKESTCASLHASGIGDTA